VLLFEIGFEHERVVVLFVFGAVHERHRALVEVLAQRGHRVPVRLQLAPVTRLELWPFPRIMVKPLP
jgi:hypothetical protein